MEKKKRPCKVKKKIIYGDNGGCNALVRDGFNGLFHKWGSESHVIHENGQKKIHSVANTLGIVEDENGQIHMIPPEDIIFTDR